MAGSYGKGTKERKKKRIGDKNRVKMCPKKTVKISDVL